jgi:hypothetical protein
MGFTSTRAVRGQTSKPLKDDIYRAKARGASHHVRDRVIGIARELASGQFHPGPGQQELRQTRVTIRAGWEAVGERLAEDGHHDLAEEVRGFARQMPAPRTEREHIAADLLERVARRPSVETYR